MNINEFAWLMIRMLGIFFVGLLIMQIDDIIHNYEEWSCHYDDCSNNLTKLIKERLLKILFFSTSAYYFLRKGKFVHNLLVSGEKTEE
jgi:hypothetical protein